MEVEGYSLTLLFLFVFAYGILGGYIFFGVDTNELILSNSTAHDICLNLTNNSAVQASADDGKLVCQLPSFDSVQNIIIKSNAEDAK